MSFDFDYIWVSPLVAMIAAQVLKPVLIMFKLRRIDLQLMRQSGGMPSSHTALVVALVTELWLREGGKNPVLAIAIFVALIVMFDAAGVRWQTGRQAAVLNRLLRDLKGQSQQGVSPAAHMPLQGDGNADPEEVVRGLRPIPVAKAPWWLVDWPVLNEHVGHKPSEVIGGCIVGLAVALLMH